LNKSHAVGTALVLGVAALAHAQTQAPTKVAILQYQKAILSTKDGQKLQTDLGTRFGPKKQEMDKRQTDLQAMQQQLQRGSATLSDEQKAKLARDIDAGTKSLNRDAEDAQTELDQAQNRGMQEIGQKMSVIITKFATSNGYSMVLDVSDQQSPILWAAPETEITADIIKLYDQAYPGATAAAPPKKEAPATPPTKPPAAPAKPPAAPPAKKQ